MNVELKLKLENVYKEYCLSDLNAIAESKLSEDEKADNEMFKSFVRFRLSVSGGSESSMGSVGCGTVEGFVNEITLFNDLMDDGAGQYRGDFSYENLEALEELLEESELEDEVKSKAVELFKKYYEIDEE
jgi:hypothetical protein